MNLASLKKGQEAIILYVGGSKAFRHRLLDMGLTPKTKVKMRKTAPMGDPLEIFVRGYELTLRKVDAKHILVEEKDNDDCFNWKSK